MNKQNYYEYRDVDNKGNLVQVTISDLTTFLKKIPNSTEGYIVHYKDNKCITKYRWSRVLIKWLKVS